MNKLLNIIFVALISSNAWALSTDTDQPVYIDSDSQHLDMKSNKVTFIGDVKLVQGSINVEAEKIVVTRDPKQGNIENIEAFGNMAKFRQLTDDGKELKGRAKELYYSMKKDQLTMLKNATLMQDDSVIKGEKIRYHITSEKMVAEGDGSTRVSTVLQPQTDTQE